MCIIPTNFPHQFDGNTDIFTGCKNFLNKTIKLQQKKTTFSLSKNLCWIRIQPLYHKKDCTIKQIAPFDQFFACITEQEPPGTGMIDLRGHIHPVLQQGPFCCSR